MGLKPLKHSLALAGFVERVNVESHNGTISLYSEPAQGTTFHIYLPKVMTEAAVSVPEQHKEPLKGGDERIMLVDDEMNIVTFTKEALEKFGYQVTPFTNAVQAYQDFQLQLVGI